MQREGKEGRKRGRPNKKKKRRRRRRRRRCRRCRRRSGNEAVNTPKKSETTIRNRLGADGVLTGCSEFHPPRTAPVVITTVKRSERVKGKIRSMANTHSLSLPHPLSLSLSLSPTLSIHLSPPHHRHAHACEINKRGKSTNHRQQLSFGKLRMLLRQSTCKCQIEPKQATTSEHKLEKTSQVET